MSTRCNIVITFGNSKLFVYRHCDGYLAVTGADIATRLQSNPYPADFVRNLLGEMYEKASYEAQARPVYELTTELHGDIEHVYYVRFSGHTNRLQGIAHSARPSGHAGDGESWAERAEDVSLADFIESVNTDRRVINARLRLIRRECKLYVNCADYPMLETPDAAAVGA